MDSKARCSLTVCELCESDETEAVYLINRATVICLQQKFNYSIIVCEKIRILLKHKKPYRSQESLWIKII
jgi:hypothetical protein